MLDVIYNYLNSCKFVSVNCCHIRLQIIRFYIYHWNKCFHEYIACFLTSGGQHLHTVASLQHYSAFW